MAVDPSTVRTPKNKCLDCECPFDAASNAYGKSQPKTNDITMCIECGHLMAFNEDLTVRALTDAEIVSIAGDKRIIDAQRARQFVMAAKRKN